jgi:hypothetical protein
VQELDDLAVVFDDRDQLVQDHSVTSSRTGFE